MASKRATVAGVPRAVLAELNAGTREARNLVESLAIDYVQLLQAVCPTADHQAMTTACREKKGVLDRTRLGGTLVAACGPKVCKTLSKHTSDTVRAWACFAIAGEPGLDLELRLERVRQFAADPHFGVREWAWMVVRPFIDAELERGIKLLGSWTLHGDANIRRFASEVTRPRGVWCAHITKLREQPELGLSLLEPLKRDESKYVQDSVANWLNDASKTRPDFVTKVTDRWLVESPTDATRRIVTRARRSMHKNSTKKKTAARPIGVSSVRSATRKASSRRVKH